MNRILFQNQDAKPFDIEDLYVCLNIYIDKFNKKPNDLLISLKSELDESLIPINYEKVKNVYPYQFQIGHTEDIDFGVLVREGESPSRYALKATVSPVEPHKVVKGIDTPEKGKRGRKGGSKAVYATINGNPSMLFDTKEEAAEHFGCSVSSININLSDSTKSGGLLKIDGVKVKLDWSYDD